MTVYKHKNSPYWHFDFIVDTKRYTGSTGVKTRRAAEGVEDRKRREAAAGTLGSAAQMTLNAAAGRWWKERGKGLASAADVERRLERVVQILGPNTRICDITTEAVSVAIEVRRGMTFTRSAKKGARKFLISDSTANRDIVDTLRPVLRRARKRWGAKGLPEVDWGELRLDEPEPQPKEFTAEEMERILAQVAPHWRDLIRFGEVYGCRLDEFFFPLSALDVADRFNARVTLRKRKNGADHILPLLPEDAAMLAARAGRAREAKLDTVWFRVLKGGRLAALHYHGAESAIRRAMTRTGLRESKGARGPHDLRHNAGMKILRATGNLRVTQKLLGHKSLQSTLVYAHAVEGDVREALAAVAAKTEVPKSVADPRNSPEVASPKGGVGR